MGKLRKLFTAHPALVGETYFQHMASAISFAVPMIGAAMAVFVHAVFPFLFVKTGSGIITKLHERMVLNRSRSAPHEQPRPYHKPS